MSAKRKTFCDGLFEDQVILITGAAGGVGSATASLLGSLGAQLALTDRDIVAEPFPINQASEAIWVAGDVSVVADCERLIDTTLDRFGRLDALVNCAGVWVQGNSDEATEEEWIHCIDVNLKGTFFMCSRAIPALKLTRGSILNLSSDAGVVGNSGAAIYCASKGGVTLLSKALAIELAPHGVRVNALCPADIMSPMLEMQAEKYGSGDPHAYFNTLKMHYPQGDRARFIEPREVAEQIAFLLSPSSAAVTGAAVMLDFGLTAGY